MTDYTIPLARIGRAREHANELERGLKAFRARQPFHVGERETEHGTIIERAEYPQPVPAVLSLMVSDAMHQARASLDNLVGALREGGPTSRSAYPVVLTEEDFEAAVGDSLKGVPDWAIQVIRRVQPFSDDLSQRYGGEQLRRLHDMARLDRHRAPHLHASLVQIDYVEGYSVQMRGDSKTWAEVEYEPGQVYRAHFKVDVKFTDGPLAGFEVAGATRSMIGIAESTIGLIRQAEWRSAQPDNA